MPVSVPTHGNEVLIVKLPTSVFNRSLLLAELEKEEKEKDWYYAQLQNLTKRIDSLPLTENVSTLSMLGHVSGAMISA